jgi:hypothetical protein
MNLKRLLPRKCSDYCSWNILLAILLLGLLTDMPLEAKYKKMTVRVESAKNYLFHQAQDKMIIAADPYNNHTKILSAFDLKEMGRRGILPVHIIITNESEHVMAVNGAAIQFVDAHKRYYESLAPEEVLRLLMQSSSQPSLGRQPVPFPIPRSSGRSSGDLFEIQTDLKNKSLERARVNPKSTAGGFVFFHISQDTLNLDGCSIYIPEVKDITGNKDFLFYEIELKN